MKKPLIAVAGAVGLCLIAGAVYFLMPRGGQKPVPSPAAKPNLESDLLAIDERPIAQPLEGETGQADVLLGRTEKDGASVTVAKGSFSTSTKVELMTPEKIPAYDKDTAEMVGAPIEIAATGKPVRLGDKATVAFKIPAGTTSADDIARLRVAYYNGQEWDYLKPDNVDVTSGVMTLGLYHFSLLAPTKLKGDDKITNDWIKAKALQDGLNKDIAKPHDAYSAQALDLSMEKLGINDTETKNQVLRSMLDDPEYKAMEGYYKTNNQVFDDKLKTLIGKKIVGQVPAPLIKNALKALKVTGATAAISKAAGNAVEGEYKDAAKEIGDFITNQFILGVAGKAAVAITNYEIRTWKNSEVEAAFKAYRDGSSGYFYGYNNDAKDFDAVWDQMRGIRRQIELEAIRQANAVRRDSGMEPLSEAQADALRNQLKEQYRKQFATRLERENELAEQEKKLIRIMDGLKAGGIFDSATGPIGLDKGFDHETKLDVVGHFIDKMMKDINRFDLTDKAGLVAEKAVSVDDLVQGVRIYFSGPNGKKDYAKFLKDRFNVSLYPTLKELEGAWSGQMTITDVIVSDELKKAQEEQKASGKKEDEGCDLDIDFEKLKGKQSPMEFNLKASGETGGTLTIKNGDKTSEVPITYDQGVLSGSFTQDKAVATIAFDASKDDDDKPKIGGGLSIDYKGMLKIKASVAASKK